MTSRPCWRRRPGVGGPGDDKLTVAAVATHVPQVAHGNQTKQQVARCGPQSPWKPNKTLTASSALLQRHPLAARIFCTNVQVPPPRRGLARPRALTLDPDSKTATVRRVTGCCSNQTPAHLFTAGVGGLGARPRRQPAPASFYATHGYTWSYAPSNCAWFQNTLPFNQTKRIFSC